MTDKNTPLEPSDKKAAPASTPSPAGTQKDTQRLNDGQTSSKPAPKVDAETQDRLRKMLSHRIQFDPAEASAKDKPAQTPPAENAKKDAPPEPSADKPEVSKGTADGKGQVWPQPARSLGEQAKPDASALQSAPTASLAPTPKPAGDDTAEMNRPQVSMVTGKLPTEPEPVSTSLLRRNKAEAQAAIRTTTATRNVPKGRMAQEVWKVIFQAATNTEVRELEIEVKGLSVVGRNDPDGDTKADLDLSPFNAGAYGVSRQHVILIPTDEGPCIIDMNSTNGTWINGLYLEPGRRYRLRTNDRVELGSLKLLVRVMSPGEQSAQGGTSRLSGGSGALNKPGISQ